MAFREVSMLQIKEALRRWMKGEGERPIAKAVGVDRKTIRRYIAGAIEVGLDRSGTEEQLTQEFICKVLQVVRPHRRDSRGEQWHKLLAQEEQIKKWVDQELTVVKIGILLNRIGVEVPPRTLARFCVERCGAGKRTVTTLRVDDPPPGIELQVDFGLLGTICDGEKQRKCHALIFTACYSRYQFVWPTFTQTTQDVIQGFEAAWQFFGGVFAVVIPDNMKSIVIKAENCAPRFNDVFLEYAQDRGFVIDAARVRTPTDKPRVERTVQYVRNNFFAGEDFTDLYDIRKRAEIWCRHLAGKRIHGTTCLRPGEDFELNEKPLLGDLADHDFDIPIWSEPKVARDSHVQVARALYSTPNRLIGEKVKARRDQTTVRLYFRDELIRVHPLKSPGQRSTNRDDLPLGKEIYATRDTDALAKIAADHGESIGIYAFQLLSGPLPWTKMRQVYRLLGLIDKFGEDSVEQTCKKALEAEAIDVNLIVRMLERFQSTTKGETSSLAVVIQGRFVRDKSEFETRQGIGQ